MQPVSRQWISKHVPTAVNTSTIELLWEMVFPTRFGQSAQKEDSWGNPVSSRQE
jgi:hypothetical protein